ncbi:MAG: acyltransferase [Elusimicrobia bacterium]|nr:acyltransferase [Elusimicrobiota bacterium]
MRKMKLNRMIAFAVLMEVWIGLSALASWSVVHHLPFQDPFVYVSIFIVAYAVGGTLLYRLLMHFFPLESGEIEPGSRQEFIYQVFYNPFNFFLFFPLSFSGLIPVPLSRLYVKLLGTRIGADSYPGRCMIFDPRFVTIGKMVVMGYNASLIPHVMEGTNLSHTAIHIGDHATIGTNAVIMSGVTIGEGAVVAAGAVVPKFTHIGEGEIWAGLPARRIGFVGKKPLALADAPLSVPRKIETEGEPLKIAC